LLYILLKKKDCTICTGWLFKRHKAARNTR